MSPLLFFKKNKFSAKQLGHLMTKAERYRHIMDTSGIPEVVFKFGYDAMIEYGIVMLARDGYKIINKAKSQERIIDAIAKKLTTDPPIHDYLKKLQSENMKRKKKNLDLYGEEEVFSGLDLDMLKSVVNAIATVANVR